MLIESDTALDDCEPVNDLIGRSLKIGIKKLARNDRNWAGNPDNHQNGIYVSGQLQDTDFFPPLVQRKDKPHIFDRHIRTYWPAVDQWRDDSRLVQYTNKGREYQFTRLWESQFEGLSPASFIVIGKSIDEKGPYWQCLTIDSLSPVYAYIEDLFELASDFTDGVFDPFQIAKEEETLATKLIAEILAALGSTGLAALCEVNKKMPSTKAIALEAQAAFQKMHGVSDFNPFNINAPGDVVRMISRDIEFELYKSYELKYRAVEILSIIFAGKTNPTAHDIISCVVKEFLSIYKSVLAASQQRKTRAGYSFEHHIKRMLVDGGVPHTEQAVIGQGRPDFILPCKELFQKKDKGPKDTLILSAKTTLRERWKQVMKEIENCDLYLATVDERIASSAIYEMKSVNVNLVVPESFMDSSITEYEGHDNVITFSDFFRTELGKTRKLIWNGLGIQF